MCQNLEKMLQQAHKYHMTALWSYLSSWLVGFYSSMAWTKVTPKGGWGKAWHVRMLAEVHPAPAEFSSPADSSAPTEPGASATEEAPQPQVRWSKGGRRQRNWNRWGGLQSHPQWDSWLRWLPKWGHQCQLGRSQPRRNSSQLWEARPPERSFSRLGSWRRPGGTG